MRSVERDAVLRKRRSLIYAQMALLWIPESDHFQIGVLHAWDVATYLQRDCFLHGHCAASEASQRHPCCEDEPTCRRGVVRPAERPCGPVHGSEA
eukprot:s479_g4.t1